MIAIAVLLMCIGGLGAFDVFTFHQKVALTRRPEARAEAWIHLARGVVYSLQFVMVAELEPHGAWAWALVGLLAVDIAIAAADVLVEPRTRQGGLPAGEYAAHMLLSLLVGAYLCLLAQALPGWIAAPTALSHAQRPLALRLPLLILAAGCALTTLRDVLDLVEGRLRRPPPVHVQIDLATSLERLWTLTQDHRLHPSWDHRFSKIVMLAATIQTGTTMRYEKRLGPITIRGFGRYKLHRPGKQSTFEFWSADRRSLIARGVGLWLYRPLPDGRIRFSTTYTYEVRWGVLGRLVDRLLFRRLIQAETERSFARLAGEHFT
jgi:hypothetical protein